MVMLVVVGTDTTNNDDNRKDPRCMQIPGVAGYGTITGPRVFSTGYKNDPINGTRN